MPNHLLYQRGFYRSNRPPSIASRMAATPHHILGAFPNGTAVFVGAGARGCGHHQILCAPTCVVCHQTTGGRHKNPEYSKNTGIKTGLNPRQQRGKRPFADRSPHGRISCLDERYSTLGGCVVYDSGGGSFDRSNGAGRRISGGYSQAVSGVFGKFKAGTVDGSVLDLAKTVHGRRATNVHPRPIGPCGFFQCIWASSKVSGGGPGSIGVSPATGHPIVFRALSICRKARAGTRRSLSGSQNSLGGW